MPTRDFEGNVMKAFVMERNKKKQTLRAADVPEPGGSLISISGSPDPQFAEGIHAPWAVKQGLSI